MTALPLSSALFRTVCAEHITGCCQGVAFPELRLSPSKHAGSEQCTEECANQNRTGIPEPDERKRRTRLVQGAGSRAYQIGRASCRGTV